MDMCKICLSWGPICPSAHGHISVCCMFRRALPFFWSAEAYHRASKDARILHWAILWWIHIAFSFSFQFTDRLGLTILNIHLLLFRGEEGKRSLCWKHVAGFHQSYLVPDSGFELLLLLVAGLYFIFVLVFPYHSYIKWPLFRSWRIFNFYLQIQVLSIGIYQNTIPHIWGMW